MTTQALELLNEDDPASNGRGGPRSGRGFLLQVEGASIDKQDHVERPCEQIGETIAFDAPRESGCASRARIPTR